MLSAYIHVADETLPLSHCSDCTDNDQVLAGTDSVPPLRPITTLPASSGSSFFSENPFPQAAFCGSLLWSRVEPPTTYTLSKLLPRVGGEEKSHGCAGIFDDLFMTLALFCHLDH